MSGGPVSGDPLSSRAVSQFLVALRAANLAAKELAAARTARNEAAAAMIEAGACQQAVAFGVQVSPSTVMRWARAGGLAPREFSCKQCGASIPTTDRRLRYISFCSDKCCSAHWAERTP